MAIKSSAEHGVEGAGGLRLFLLEKAAPRRYR